MTVATDNLHRIASVQRFDERSSLERAGSSAGDTDEKLTSVVSVQSSLHESIHISTSFDFHLTDRLQSSSTLPVSYLGFSSTSRAAICLCADQQLDEESGSCLMHKTMVKPSVRDRLNGEERNRHKQ